MAARRGLANPRHYGNVSISQDLFHSALRFTENIFVATSQMCYNLLKFKNLSVDFTNLSFDFISK